MIDDELGIIGTNELGVTTEEFEQEVCPLPGIYPDMPAAHYHRIDAASASRLKKLKRSAAHMRASILYPPEPTPAMRLGSLIHSRVLEPNLYRANYAVMPKVDGRTKAGKAAKEEFEIENLGKSIVTEEEDSIAQAIHDSLRSCEFAARLLDAEGTVETSLFWQHADTGLMCKNRLDKHMLFDARMTIMDLKTTIDASPKGFEREIFNYGYHIQAAFYLDGMSQLMEESHTDFYFLAVEKVNPYAFGIYRLSDEAVEQGRKEYKQLLVTYKECEEQQRWPGYGEALQSISLPNWAFNQ
jgi:hypothetical protein